MYSDLRSFLEDFSSVDSCKTIKGADWDLEIGLITELQLQRPDQPVLIFDEIKGYEQGYRVVTNLLNTEESFARMFGIEKDVRGIHLVKAVMEILGNEYKPVKPTLVKKGKVEENISYNNDVDLFRFPVPIWHKDDGGRYIGTGCIVILKDPDSGWTNLGTYRVQVHEKNKAAIHIVKGHHGDMIRQKYWSKGLGCPVAVVCGQEPLLYSVASNSICPQGIDDYDYCGWLKGSSIEVVQGKTVNLLIPANAEIVVEGEILPPGTETVQEGPFAEWEGYYAGGQFTEPVFRVNCVLHRDSPILMGQPPFVAKYDNDGFRNIIHAAGIWNELNKDIPGITGVWCPNEMRGLIMTIVSIRQLYHGHTKQVAMRVASSKMSQLGRYIVIVDEDIDPSNMTEVLWAIGTRCDPKNAIDIINGFCGMRSDPLLHPDKKERNELYYSKAIFHACKPYSWIERFPKSIKGSVKEMEEIDKKWGKILFDSAER
jgi:4-hydroxy-3-polyprenylbenzoate decarboxylase